MMTKGWEGYDFVMMIREGVDKLVEAEERYEESNVQIGGFC